MPTKKMLRKELSTLLNTKKLNGARSNCPLHFAAKTGAVELIAVLLHFDARLDSANNKGKYVTIRVALRNLLITSA